MSISAKNMTAVAFIMFSALFPVVHAALLDRGGGLLYDDVLDITWLQDANYAKTSGYDANGLMTWADANLWANTLVYHDPIRSVDLDGWRLPTVKPVGAAFNYEWQLDGSSDEGYNITSTSSELSFMYYMNLGLKGSFSTDGTYRSDFGVFASSVAIWSGEVNVGPVANLQSYIYWAKSGDTINDAWIFTTAEGNQRDGFPHPNGAFAWAVRAGDVAAVPEPEFFAMLLAGLGLVCALSRKNTTKKQRTYK